MGCKWDREGVLGKFGATKASFPSLGSVPKFRFRSQVLGKLSQILGERNLGESAIECASVFRRLSDISRKQTEVPIGLIVSE